MQKIFRGSPLTIKFADDKKIQLFRVGTFYDERYGKIEISKDHLKQMKKNFDERIRGVDIALDFAHRSEDISAGWFKTVELRNGDTELWAEVEYTEPGKVSIEGKEFRYISPEFHLNYQDNESLKQFGAVLLGAGLTNRPVIKGMAPTTSLRELTNKEIEEMKTAEELQKEIESMKAKFSEMEGEKKALEEKMAGMEDKKKASEPSSPEEMMKKISEQAAMIAELQSKLQKQEQAMMASEKSKKFDELLSKGTVCEAQREAYMANDMVKFSELAKPVKLSAQGGNGDDTEIKDEEAQDKVLELAEKAVKEKGIKFADAISLVLSENKDLADKYNKAVTL